MRINPLFAVALVGGVVALVAMLWDERKPTTELRARARRPLTALEQQMYVRLVDAFPGMVVLAQVALSALMSTPRKDRNRYNHKVVDFVLLDKAFEVQAIVELDDESQESRHTVGEPVRALLELAGYRVFEFVRIPEIDELHRLIGAPVRKPRSAS